MSKISNNLKETLFSKNNISSIYLSIVKHYSLKLDSSGKAVLSNKIVSSMKKSFGCRTNQ